MLKVNKRNGFSDRNKINPVNTEIQLYEFDERTRIRLNNLVTDIYEEAFHGYTTYDTILQGFLRFIMDEVYVKPMGIHKVCDEQTVVSFISETIMHDKFDAVLTVVEAISASIPVVAINDESFKNSVIDDLDGYLYNNDKDYIEYISKIYEDKNLYNRLSKQARILSNDFTSEFFAKRVLKVYETAIENYKKENKKISTKFKRFVDKRKYKV